MLLLCKLVTNVTNFTPCVSGGMKHNSGEKDCYLKQIRSSNFYFSLLIFLENSFMIVLLDDKLVTAFAVSANPSRTKGPQRTSLTVITPLLIDLACGLLTWAVFTRTFYLCCYLVRRTNFLKYRKRPTLQQVNLAKENKWLKTCAHTTWVKILIIFMNTKPWLFRSTIPKMKSSLQ